MENNLKTLQLFYASVMADAVKEFHKAGILDQVTENKHKQQSLTAPAQLNQLNINTPKELFEKFSELFGCIQWNVQENTDEFKATGEKCLLCALAKKLQTAAPCRIYCINPLKSLLKAMNPSYDLVIEKTLWNGNACIFKAVSS
jgi:hypothetical protein